MSVARSSECLLCSFSRVSHSGRAARRQLHASPIHQNRKPRFPSIRLPTKPKSEHPLNYLHERADQFLSEDAAKPKDYSPEQRAAIEAAYKFGTLKHIKESRGRLDGRPWTLNYFDDLTQIDPVIDKAVLAPWTNLDDNSRLKDEDEIEDDFMEQAMQDTELEKWVDEDGVSHMMPKVGEDDWRDFDKNMRLTIGREEAERQPRSALAPDIPNLSIKPKAARTFNADGTTKAAPAAPSPALLALMQATGLSRQQIQKLRVKTLFFHYVTNQTRLGKISRAYYISVAGNRAGMIGVGEGKSAENADAMLQSQYRAIRSMVPILRYENRTIFGDLKAKFSATELEMFPRPPGTGLRCGRFIWEICKCAGIDDISARVNRARNPMNTIKAAIQALMSQKDPEDIARARGKKLVDVRKVYYAGLT